MTNYDDAMKDFEALLGSGAGYGVAPETPPQ